MIYPPPTRIIADPKGGWMAVIGGWLTSPVHPTRADAWLYIVYVEQGWVEPIYVTKRTPRVRLELDQ